MTIEEGSPQQIPSPPVASGAPPKGFRRQITATITVMGDGVEFGGELL